MGKYSKSNDDESNTTFTSVKVGLAGHCTSPAMIEALSDASLFVSQSREFGGLRAQCMMALTMNTTDQARKMELMNYIGDPTSKRFMYKCINRHGNEQLHEMLPLNILDCFDFDELGMSGKSVLLSSASDEMEVNCKNHMKNFTRYQRFALGTQASHLYPKISKKNHKKVVRTLAKMINNMDTFEIPIECESDEALAIVDCHRRVLGLGHYSIFKASMDKYRKSVKKKNFKEGKGRKKKVARPKDKVIYDGSELDTVTVMEYFNFCLRIQEQVDDTRRFHLIPQWKGQHGHATVGNRFFTYLLKAHGDDEDKKQLKGMKDICNHPNKRALWAKVSDEVYIIILNTSETNMLTPHQSLIHYYSISTMRNMNVITRTKKDNLHMKCQQMVYQSHSSSKLPTKTTSTTTPVQKLYPKFKYPTLKQRNVLK